MPSRPSPTRRGPSRLAAVALTLVAVSGCKSTPPASSDPDLEALLGQMTLKEKLGQLHQVCGDLDDPQAARIDEKFRAPVERGEVGSVLSAYGAALTCDWQRTAVEKSRLKIPLLFAFDVIHGLRTTFPVPLAEASSWDPALLEASARIAATEATAAGIHWTFAPMVDVARDARWGRIVEGAGEDPYLGSVLAAARVRGFQGRDLAAPDTLLACAKHFVAYGAAESGRDYNTVDVSARTLHEVYLPPFRAAVDAGAATFMSAFNEVAGVPMTANGALINGLLRHRWGYAGLVVSDWESVGELLNHGVAGNRAEAATLAIRAGVDIEMVSGTYAETLEAQLAAGRVSMATIDAAVRRVLRAKKSLGLFDDPYRYCKDTARPIGPTPEHRAEARRVAERSIVLLKNEGGVLPLSRGIHRLAVIGALADDATSALGPWSTPGWAGDVVTVLAGLRQAVDSETQILVAPGASPDSDDASGIAPAVETARQADAVVLVLGERASMSGEAASRAHVDLPGAQQALADAVLALGKPTVVVLMNGRPLAIEALAQKAPAVVEAWFLGVEMGPAVARVLFGDVNPSGKLPVSFPRATGQEPLYYNAKNTGRPSDPDTKWTSKFIDVGIPALFPFGHGLSYTEFAYADLVAPKAARLGDTLTVELAVKNSGTRVGTEVVQLYVRDPVAQISRPVKELKGFARVELAAGATRRVRFTLPTEMLAYAEPDGTRVLEPGRIELMLGSSSTDIRLRSEVELVGETRRLADGPVLFSAAEVMAAPPATEAGH